LHPDRIFSSFQCRHRLDSARYGDWERAAGEIMKLDPRNFLAFSALYRSFEDLVSGPGARMRVADEFLKIKSGTRVLDVGCGPGDMRPYLPETDYCGMDINP